MEKVKITKEQAKSIDDKISKGLSLEQFVEYHATGKGKWDDAYLNIMTLDAVIRALYIGYEVEETPEEKVRKYAINTLSIVHGTEIRAGIIDVLNILNIKIEGVNT